MEPAWSLWNQPPWTECPRHPPPLYRPFARSHKTTSDVRQLFKKGELEKFCSLDFHFKEVNNRFKKPGL
jgi:hypothetical protein